MTLYARRERLTRYSEALGALLGRLPLTANGWTLLGLAAGLATAIFLARGRFFAAGLIYLSSGFCDLADGAVARQRGSASELGAYLDTLADRTGEAAALFGLLLADLPPLGLTAPCWIFLYLFLGLMVTYAKAAAREKGLLGEELRGGGILERAERVIILGAGLLLGGLDPAAVSYVLALLTALAAISLLQRVRLVVAHYGARRGAGGP